MLKKYDFRLPLFIAISKKRQKESEKMYVGMWMYVDEFPYNLYLQENINYKTIYRRKLELGLDSD